jgi:hypothetical protein
MRTAPAIQVSLNRFGAWRAAMLVLTLFGALALGGWQAGRDGLSAAHRGIAIVVAAGAMLWLCMSLARLPAVQLAWDGQRWTLEPMAPARAEPIPGEITVSVDLVPRMLLRFRPAMSSRWVCPSWLPVQRRGPEPHWHALRCAVYSPRPLDSAGRLGADASVPR